MKKFYALFGVFALLAFFGFKTAIVSGGVNPDKVLKWIDVYERSLRIPLFTAFLTLGSFLLALKTNIIQRLQAAYDCEEYETLYLLSRETRPDAPYYGGLSRLAQALSLNVASSLITSISQMSFGFVGVPWAVAICFTMAALTLGLSLYLWLQIVLAHRVWFRTIEIKKQDEIAKKEGKNRS
jgi:hypothetical protein